MSETFNSFVKSDLCKVTLKHQHCMTAELAGIIHTSASLTLGTGGVGIQISTESKNIINRIYSLVKKVYNINSELTQSSNRLQTEYYQIRIIPNDYSEFLANLGIDFEQGFGVNKNNEVFRAIISKDCCKASYLRGAFLVGGIISNPESSYHLEIISGSELSCDAIKSLIESMNFKTATIGRKTGTATYIKDAQGISDFLKIIGAHNSVLKLEDIRMIKEIKNNLNRQINFENANIDKTVNSSLDQVNNINKIDSQIGLESIAPSLQEAARARLENPQATLSELAEMCGISKSGMNNRFRKIAEIAEKL